MISSGVARAKWAILMHINVIPKLKNSTGFKQQMKLFPVSCKLELKFQNAFGKKKT